MTRAMDGMIERADMVRERLYYRLVMEVGDWSELQVGGELTEDETEVYIRRKRTMKGTGMLVLLRVLDLLFAVLAVR